MNEIITAITIAVALAAPWFLICVLLARCLGHCSREIPKPHPKERERIENHQEKQTLIIPAKTPAKNETQVMYFAPGKGFIDGRTYKA